MRRIAKPSMFAVLLLTGCGGSGDPDSASRSSAPQPAASAAAQEPSTPPDIGQFMVATPRAGETLDSVVVLRAHLMDAPASGYAMCWQVDGGQLNPMTPEDADRVAYVDVRGWDWSQAGPYFITLVAQDPQGRTIGRRSIPVFVDRPGSRDAVPVVPMSRDRCAGPVR